jgi:polysaccharide pyruvyl transferase WcaK-like protein
MTSSPSHTRRAPATRRVTRLGFWGVLGSGNIGNDASLDAMIGFIREAHPEAELAFFAMGPERMEEEYGGRATHMQWYEDHMDRLRGVPAPILKIIGRALDPFRTMAWVRRQDIVIVPGMGILETTVPMRPWGFPYGLFMFIVCARLARTRTAMVAVGADAIRRPLTRWLITSAARLADHRSYRDTHSRDAMRAMGVDVSADEVCPDLAFARPVSPAVPDGSGTVGLGLMDYEGSNDERARSRELRANYMDVMKRFARWLVDRGRPVRLYICDPMDTGVVEEMIADLRRYRPDLDPSMVTAEPVATIQQLSQQMSTIDTVVATRFHNVIGAVQLSLPTVSISYSSKHDELMERMGLGEFCQPARSVDFDRLVEQFETVESRREELVATMTERNEENVEGVHRQLTALSDLVVGASEAER